MKHDSALRLLVPDNEQGAAPEWKFPDEINWLWQSRAASGLYLLELDSL